MDSLPWARHKERPDHPFNVVETYAVALNELADWWVERLLRLTEWGVTGFRCESPHLIPPTIWRIIIAAVKHRCADCRFLAWTPGLEWSAIARLRGVGFDAAFSSAAWWDGRASWIVDEHELLRGIGSVIGCAEAPYGPRLAQRLQNSTDRRGTYRHLLRRGGAVFRYRAQGGHAFFQ